MADRDERRDHRGRHSGERGRRLGRQRRVALGRRPPRGRAEPAHGRHHRSSRRHRCRPPAGNERDRGHLLLQAGGRPPARLARRRDALREPGRRAAGRTRYRLCRPLRGRGDDRAGAARLQQLGRHAQLCRRPLAHHRPRAGRAELLLAGRPGRLRHPHLAGARQPCRRAPCRTTGAGAAGPRRAWGRRPSGPRTLLLKRKRAPEGARFCSAFRGRRSGRAGRPRSLAVLPEAVEEQQDRATDIDRRGRRDDDAEQHRPGEGLDRIATPDRHRQQRDRDGERGEDASHDHLVDRQVDEIRERHRLVLAQVLAHAVVHHHLVVDRVADQRQHGGDGRQVKVDLHQREETDHLGDIQDQRGDGAHGEVPLEAPPDVDQDGEHAEADGEEAGAGKLGADRRADHFRALEVRVRNHFGNAIAYLLESCGLHLFTARLTLDADEDRRALAELLQRDFTEVKAFHLLTQRREVDGRLGGRFHLDTADEVDTVVEARREEQMTELVDEGRHSDGDIAAASRRRSGFPKPAEERMDLDLLHLPDDDRLAHQEAHEGDRGEHRDRKTDDHGDGEAAPNRAEHEQQDHADHGRHVAVDDGGIGLVEADIERLHGPRPRRRLFADTGVDQDVGVDRHTDAEDDTGDTGQGQRGARMPSRPMVRIVCSTRPRLAMIPRNRRAPASAPRRRQGRQDPCRDPCGSFRTEVRTDGALLDDGERGRQRAGAQQRRKHGRFLRVEVTGDLALAADDRLTDDRRGERLAVEDDGEGLADIGLRDFSELACAGGIEAERDDRLVRTLVEAGFGVGKAVAGNGDALFDGIFVVIVGARQDHHAARGDAVRVHGLIDHVEASLRGRPRS